MDVGHLDRELRATSLGGIDVPNGNAVVNGHGVRHDVELDGGNHVANGHDRLAGQLLIPLTAEKAPSSGGYDLVAKFDTVDSFEKTFRTF